MTTTPSVPALIADELELLDELMPPSGRDIIKLGCRAARLAGDSMAGA